MDEATTHETSLKKLIKKRFDPWTLSDLEGPSVARAAGIGMDEIEIAYTFKEEPSYIMLSRDTPKDTVERWQNAYIDLPEDRILRGGSKEMGPHPGTGHGICPRQGVLNQVERNDRDE